MKEWEDCNSTHNRCSFVLIIDVDSVYLLNQEQFWGFYIVLKEYLDYIAVWSCGGSILL